MSASLAPECNEPKERYDSCFLKWYSEKYLRGKGTTDECAPLFKEYKTCLTSALKERGIDKMLEEAREDHKESDQIHMRRKCKFCLLSNIHSFTDYNRELYLVMELSSRH